MLFGQVPERSKTAVLFYGEELYGVCAAVCDMTQCFYEEFSICMQIARAKCYRLISK